MKNMKDAYKILAGKSAGRKALVGGEWSDSRLCRFTPAERAPSIHWIGSWVDPRAGLDDMEK
jgi:hypothetical protein